MSTPAGRFNRMSVSIVLLSGSSTSINRLCVRISKCSCEFLSMNGERFTVKRSPFIDKNSQEHFEIRTHKRLIDVLDPDNKTIDTLMRLNLPAGVDIDRKSVV